MTNGCCRSPEGRWLASGALVCELALLRCLFKRNFSGSADNKIVIWDTATWTVHHTLATPAAHVLALAWWRVRDGAEDSAIDDGSGGRHVLAAGTWEGQLLMWVGTNTSATHGEL